MTGLRGMTWDHPRAYLPLQAFAERHPAPSVTWDRQPLADFEARPLESLAPSYDFLVVDHPGLGHAIATGAILPWDKVFTADELAVWAGTTVGRTWASYTLDDAQWALPIDAATQVGIRASDLRHPLPTAWTDVPAASHDVATALCLGGPHAFLMLLAMCADDSRTTPDLLDPQTAEQALDLLTWLWRSVDREVSLGDPITVHEAIAAGATDWCPLAYGYASYAGSRAGRRALAWADAPTFATERPGSVLGGTGLALSAQRDTDLDAVRDWVGAFLATDVQAGLVPSTSGQPAHRAAWDSPQVDAGWNGYYSATRRSVDTAWIRPRHDGWVALQDEASEMVREVIDGRARATDVVAEINRRSRS